MRSFKLDGVLDGACAESHDSLRGRGTFKKTISQIKKLRTSGVQVGINTLVHEQNFHELEQIISLAFDLGCSGVNPINLVQLGRACDSKLQRVSETEIFQRTSNHLEQHPEHLSLFRRTSMFASIGSAVLAGVSCHTHS